MKKPKIMIVDDEKNLGKMLKLNLDAKDKYEVRVLHEPLKAISAIERIFSGPVNFRCHDAGPAGESNPRDAY